MNRCSCGIKDICHLIVKVHQLGKDEVEEGVLYSHRHGYFEDDY